MLYPPELRARKGGFCVSGDPLLDDLLGAGSGNTIFYHGRAVAPRPELGVCCFSDQRRFL